MSNNEDSFDELFGDLLEIDDRTPSQRYLANNKDICRQRCRDYHSRNKQKILAYNRKWYHDNKDKAKNSRLRRTYNITIDEYDKMVIEQDNKCAICKNKFDIGKYAQVDHDHKTGKVRGLLCTNCNTRLGWYESNYIEMYNYLKKYTTS